MSKMKCKRLCVMLTLSLLLVCMMGTTAFAAGTGDVAGAVESTWATASTQIKTVVNNVVFPAIDLILAVFFFAKLGTAYFDYRKSGQFEWRYSSLPSWGQAISTSKEAVSLNGRHLPSCSRASCSR